MNTVSKKLEDTSTENLSQESPENITEEILGLLINTYKKSCKEISDKLERLDFGKFIDKGHAGLDDFFKLHRTAMIDFAGNMERALLEYISLESDKHVKICINNHTWIM